MNTIALAGLALVAILPQPFVQSAQPDAPLTWVELGEPYCGELTMMPLPVFGPHTLPAVEGVVDADEQFWTAQVAYSFDRSACPAVVLQLMHSAAENPWVLQPLESAGTTGFRIRVAQPNAPSSWMRLETADGASLLTWFADPQQ